MLTDICMDMCTDIWMDMCIDICMDMCKDMCMDMCTDICMDMWTDMCIDMCINIGMCACLEMSDTGGRTPCTCIHVCKIWARMRMHARVQRRDDWMANSRVQHFDCGSDHAEVRT